MAIDYVMPKLAMAMNEGTINEWLVEEGEYVQKGQPLATIETEKVAYDIESSEEGYFHIILPVGQTVDCDTLIAQYAENEQELADLQAAGVPRVAAPAEDAATAAMPVDVTAAVTPVSSGGRVIASPLAKKIAADKQLDLRAITGTGPGGRIVKRDVLVALERGAARVHAETTGSRRELARIPMAGVRKTIAGRMVQSLQETAQLSSSWESDITDLLAMRRSFIVREEQLGSRVSFNAFLVKAMVYAIRQVPVVNSCLEGDEIVIYDTVNMGVAVSVPCNTACESSLAVAVLHNVEHMGVVEIDRGMKALIERVRTGQASADDLSGSTITLSSTAGLAPPGMTTTPVLNQPNAALLGPSTPIERPIVHEGEVAVRTMLPLSFTFDHRIFDGEPAARYMSALHEALEHPELLMA